MSDFILITLGFGILINMILLLNVLNDLANLRADLYYYSEQDDREQG